jgi:hypothetical protein
MLFVTGSSEQSWVDLVKGREAPEEPDPSETRLIVGAIVYILANWNMRCDNRSSIAYLADVARRAGAQTIIIDLAHSGGCSTEYARRYATLLLKKVDAVIDIDVGSPDVGG